MQFCILLVKFTLPTLGTALMKIEYVVESYSYIDSGSSNLPGRTVEYMQHDSRT